MFQIIHMSAAELNKVEIATMEAPWLDSQLTGNNAGAAPRREYNERSSALYRTELPGAPSSKVCI